MNYSTGLPSFEEDRKVGLDQLKQGGCKAVASSACMTSRHAGSSSHRAKLNIHSSPRYGDIPADTRTEIDDSIRAKGRTPTNDEVERVYQRAIDGRVIK